MLYLSQGIFSFPCSTSEKWHKELEESMTRTAELSGQEQLVK